MKLLAIRLGWQKTPTKSLVITQLRNAGLIGFALHLDRKIDMGVLRCCGKHATRGFTLLEMLVVMVIIGLLAGLVGPRLFGKVDSSKVQTAQVQIKMLGSALSILRLDVGQLPPQEQGLQWLLNPPTEESLRPLWRGPYIEGMLPMDPWNNPYQYKVPGSNNKPFVIYSFGADGKEGGDGLNADIGLN